MLAETRFIPITREQASILQYVSNNDIEAKEARVCDEIASAYWERQPAQREWRVTSDEWDNSIPGPTYATREQAEEKCRPYPSARIESRIVGEWEPVEEARGR